MHRGTLVSACTFAIALLVLLAADSSDAVEERLARHRNLGKAFFENPTTQKEAIDEFRKAFDLAPDSTRERLNYALALVAGGRSAEGIAELEKVQRQDPKLPHTWFNLGIQFKKAGEFDKAARQFEQMVKLVPGEPVSHYNLGALYKLAGRNDDAVREFELASRLDPNLAAPHFQLYNLYRQMGRREDATRRLQLFQQAKKEQENAAVPEDMEWSFYSEIYDLADAKAAEDAARPVALKFLPRSLASGIDAASAGLALLDANADARPDLLAWSSTGIRLLMGGSLPSTQPALAVLTSVVHAAPGDFDNDGFPDLCILGAKGPELLKNTKGRFSAVKLDAPAGSYSSAIWLDFDHDYDLDLILLGPRSVLLRNQGAAGFAVHTHAFPFVSGHALSAVAFRIVADSKSLDLAVSYRDRPGVLYRDKLAGKFEAVPLEQLPAGAQLVSAADFDHNGSVDLVAESGGKSLLLRNLDATFASVPAPGASPVLVDLENRAVLDLLTSEAFARNQGQGRFSAAKLPAGLPPAARWIAADFNLDGKEDLAAVTPAGALQLFANQSPAANFWLRVQLAGVKNLKLAAGAEVEVKAGVRYQKKIYLGTPLLFGLRSYKEADTVRITWPNGLIQNEARQLVAKNYSYKEAQRLSGSCPMIWTWNGREFQYVTDVLGVAPLGASDGEGSYFPTDSREHIFIPADALVPRGGRYEIRITEELSEVTYLDQVELMAVDHPAAVSIFLNEKFQAPPYPDLRLYGAEKRFYPRSALDHGGRDVRSRLLARDASYPDRFPRRENGIADTHALELDFGAGAAGNRAVLVLSGWVDWADGSTFLAQAQEGRGGLITPYLQVQDSAGQWRTVLQDMGMPAGKPKTIAVDLTGKFLSPGRKVRIVTNLCVYWDEIFLIEDSREPAVSRAALVPASASLRFRGFSRNLVHPERKQPERFFYPDPLPVSMWNPTPGLYTRYGPVEDLTAAADDRFVIMGSGDELRLLFDARRLPPLPAGWSRDFILAVDGWAKDRDANTAFSQTVTPLPFHAMSRYPYPSEERFPDGPAHQSWASEYNTRPALRFIRPLVGGN